MISARRWTTNCSSPDVSEFLKMGFSPDQFYHDGDEADFEDLRTVIATFSPATHCRRAASRVRHADRSRRIGIRRK